MRWNRKELKLEADTQHNLSINQSVHWSFITSSGSLSLPSWTRPNMITNNQSGLVHPPPPPATDLLDILIQANRSWLRPHRKHLADITDEDITSQVKRSNRTASTVCVCVFILTDRQTGESTGVSLRSRSHMIPSDWSDWRHGSETRSPRTRGG